MNGLEDAAAWLETEDGRRLRLEGNCRLGRAADNHIIIDGAKASRYHAAIHAQGDHEYWLIDLGSRNGTLRNAMRILQPTRLRDGDNISLAGAAFLFRQPSDSATTRTRFGQATVTDFHDHSAWLLIADIEGFTALTQTLPPGQLAMNVGRWIQESQRLLGKGHGHIAKFLGDGFLACWEAPGDQAKAVAETLLAFHQLRESGAIKFRVVVHYGIVTFGGAVQFGEEGIIGSELNFIFRLEKLASSLDVTFGASAAACARLKRYLSCEAVPGEHTLKGFPGTHRCFRIAWPK